MRANATAPTPRMTTPGAAPGAGVGVAVGAAVGGTGVGVGVSVGGAVGAGGSDVGVGGAVGVSVGVSVGVALGVSVGVRVNVADGVGVSVGAGVSVGVGGAGVSGGRVVGDGGTGVGEGGCGVAVNVGDGGMGVGVLVGAREGVRVGTVWFSACVRLHAPGAEAHSTIVVIATANFHTLAVVFTSRPPEWNRIAKDYTGCAVARQVGRGRDSVLFCVATEARRASESAPHYDPANSGRGRFVKTGSFCYDCAAELNPVREGGVWLQSTSLRLTRAQPAPAS